MANVGRDRTKFELLFPLILTIGYIFLVFSFRLYLDLNAPYIGYEKEKYFMVKKGEKSGEILERLYEEGIVKERYPIKIAYALTLKRKTLKAGLYYFNKPLSPLSVLKILERGESILIKITLKEGLTIEEYAKEMSQVKGNFKEYLKEMKNPEFIRELDPEAETLEGYMLPETYLFNPFSSEREIIKRVINTFKEFWKRETDNRKDIRLRETIILSSIVEKETSSRNEKAKIAGVFLNRLRLKMPLQSDPTTIYALKRRGLYRGFLTKEDLKIEDPFNTYVNVGLPPAPICSPSKETILSVINAEKHKLLYFVSKGDGTHFFSESLESHNQAIKRFQMNGKRKK